MAEHREAPGAGQAGSLCLNKTEGAPRGRRIRFVPVTLRELRIAQGAKLRELAAVAGLSPGLLSQIERGRLVATPAEADRIAHALRLPAGALVTRTMLVHERSEP